MKWQMQWLDKKKKKKHLFKKLEEEQVGGELTKYKIHTWGKFP